MQDEILTAVMNNSIFWGVPGVKRQRRGADHSPPSNADVKNDVDLYIHSPIRLRSAVLN
jgi:hypothetical protein